MAYRRLRTSSLLAHHDGVRFANGREVTLQELGAGVKGYVYDALTSSLSTALCSQIRRMYCAAICQEPIQQ